MGWTQFTMHEPVKEWFKKEWEYSDSDYEVIDSALVNRKTLYGAIRQNSTGDVFCAVFLVRWNRGYEYNFSYKSLTEHSGPVEIDCPKKIFKLLTPLNDDNDSNGWAREWREKVQEYHNQKEILKKNVIFKTNRPIDFVGGTYQYFKRLRFCEGHQYQWYGKRKRTMFVPYYLNKDNQLMMDTGVVKFDPSYYKCEIVSES